MRLLISRTDKIGDTVLTLPVAHDLRAAFPDATIDMLVAPLCQPLAELCPAVDGHVLYQPGNYKTSSTIVYERL